ncbi:unnamed protein product [Caenorhabditis sp. 36 PRJEB53466]|nr:unnamed protein product [Caenorhabditis sp. 36 PRJEB53466]
MIRHGGSVEEVEMFFGMLKVEQLPLVAFIVNDNNDVQKANGGSHWSLLVFDRQKDQFRHFDPISGNNHRVALKLIEKARQLVGQNNMQNGLEVEKVLQQTNSRDCGLYVAQYLWTLADTAQMITPVFWISQEDDSLVIRIRAPHGNLAELDYEHGENMFVFTCPPYFLRLHFKQMVQEYGSGTGKLEWKSEEGEFHIRVPKLHRGEHFTNLDMITELLNPSREIHGRPLVEEVQSEENEEEMEEDPEGNEFLVDQEVSKESEASDYKIEKFGYGFGWSKAGVIERLREEIGHVVDLPNPEDVEIGLRISKCATFDYKKFDEGRYLADTVEPEEELIAIIAAEFNIKLSLTDDDRVKLKDLKTKPSRIQGSDCEVATSLVDIVFAYCYDQRVNDWESTCESGWTCSKLSPSLSYLTKFDTVREALLSATRRAVSYPLYRSFNLAVKVIEDTKKVFLEGRSALLHVLCDLNHIFVASGEFRYILNDLFITDYLIWIQSVPENVIEDIQKQLAELPAIHKTDLGWDLDMLETNAKLEKTTLDSDDDPDPVDE